MSSLDGVLEIVNALDTINDTEDHYKEIRMMIENIREEKRKIQRRGRKTKKDDENGDQPEKKRRRPRKDHNISASPEIVNDDDVVIVEQHSEIINVEEYNIEHVVTTANEIKEEERPQAARQLMKFYYELHEN